jgi:flavin-dependent dehydrogenase
VRAALVVGADGWRSRVAAAVAPPSYREVPPLLVGYYAYWSGLPMAGRFEIYIRPRRGFAAAPTHDGQTLVIAGWPYDEFAANKHDLEATYLATLALAPGFAARLARARRESKLAGAAIPNYFRQPYGPGWALVGDAGYLKDSITAQGIHDAFRDAELCARAVDEHLRGGRAWADAGADYQRARDADSLAMYEFTCQLATLAPPPPEQQRLFAAIAADRAASDEFARANAGTISPGDFFAPASLARFAAAP